LSRTFVVLFRDGTTVTVAGSQLEYTPSEPPEAERGVVEVIAAVEGKAHGMVVAVFPLSLIQCIYDASKPAPESDLA
jgi:hypothetical protein